MADHSLSTTLLTSDFNMTSDDTIQQEWKYILTRISEKITKKLYAIAIFNILMGVTIIGIDIGLMTNDDLVLFTGIINGIYAIFMGIIILLFCRDQVYILTSFFILLFFQIFFLLLAVLAFGVSIAVAPYGRPSYLYHREGRFHTNLLIKIFGLFLILMSICVTIYSLIIIKNGRRPPAASTTANCQTNQYMLVENI